MSKVEDIFTDCDKLIEVELELKAKTNGQIALEFTKEGQTIYILGNVNVQGGHALISCQLGNNVDLSYQNNRLVELPQEQNKEDLVNLNVLQQAQILQPTYGTPGSSKNN